MNIEKYSLSKEDIKILRDPQTELRIWNCNFNEQMIIHVIGFCYFKDGKDWFKIKGFSSGFIDLYEKLLSDNVHFLLFDC